MEPDQGTWLCADDFARRRRLDMERPLRPARTAFFALLVAAVVTLGHWVGWWPAAALPAAAAGFAVGDFGAARSKRPEYWMACAWAFSQLVLGAAVAATGGATSAFFPLIGIPVPTLRARFATRGVVAGVAWTTAIALAAGFSRNGGAIVEAPQLLVVPLT